MQLDQWKARNSKCNSFQRASNIWLWIGNGKATYNCLFWRPPGMFTGVLTQNHSFKACQTSLWNPHPVTNHWLHTLLTALSLHLQSSKAKNPKQGLISLILIHPQIPGPALHGLGRTAKKYIGKDIIQQQSDKATNDIWIRFNGTRIETLFSGNCSRCLGKKHLHSFLIRQAGLI